jgi:site-specific DNA-methyltransferase (adenine-specific)
MINVKKNLILMIDLNVTYNESCLDTMGRMSDNFIKLTVTSPPYDDLRTYNKKIGSNKEEYNGYSFPFEDIAKELYRVTQNGGVVVWVVSDATHNGSETGTSFRQALYFKEIGFNLHDTMIYRKLNPPPNSGIRYQQMFEYMFIFSKGKPTTTNISLRDRSNKCNDKRTYRKKKFSRNKDGEFNENDYFVKEKVPDFNVWDFYVGGGNSTNDKVAFEHPAIFPEELVRRHLESWSNEGDLVYDPFMGSGTTSKMCRLINRNYIGSELSSEYCEIEKKRLSNILPKLF